jgi:hypothetical protein
MISAGVASTKKCLLEEPQPFHRAGGSQNVDR